MYLYIFNPEANRGKAKKLKKRIQKYLEDLNIVGEFVELGKDGDVADIVKGAIKEKIETIVAISGDGVVNEIIQNIVDKDITLGIVPTGETNLLANILKINGWKMGCEILSKGKIIDIDLGLAGDRYFTASVEIENEIDQEKILGIIPRAKKKKYYPMTLNIDPEETNLKIQTNVSSIMVSTIPFSSSGNLNLEENLTDKKLHLLIRSKPIINSKRKKEKNGDELTKLEGEIINIKSKSSIMIKADGEICGETPIGIKVVPKSLRIISPEKEATEKTND